MNLARILTSAALGIELCEMSVRRSPEISPLVIGHCFSLIYSRDESVAPERGILIDTSFSAYTSFDR